MTIGTQVALIQQGLDSIREDIEKFVTQAEFAPIKALVYGAAGLMLTTVICSLLYLVIRK